MRKLLVFLLVFALLASLGAGCGKKDAAEPSDGQEPAPGDQPAEEPKEKVLVVALAGETECLDNQQSTGPMKNVLINIADWQWWGYETVELADGRLIVDTEQVQPRMITGWEEERHDDGSVTYTMHIRPGMTHFSGNPVTAEDFVKSMKRRAKFGRDASERTWNAIYSNEPGTLEIVDDLTFKINAPQPSVGDLFKHLGPMRIIYDWKTIEEEADPGDEDYKEHLKRHLPASGPYMLDSWTTGVELVLKCHEDWWGDAIGERPYFDKVVFRIVPSEADRILLLRSGEVDFAFNISAKEALAMKDEPGVQVATYPSQEYLYCGMNPAMEPFDNVKVRQAMNYAFPYQAVLDQAYQGAAQRFNGALPTGCPLAPEEPYYTEDLDKAKALLEEAGYGDGLKLKLSIDEAQPVHESIAVFFQGNLKKIGVDLEIEKLPAAVFQSETRGRKLAMLLDQTLWWVNDPLFMLEESFRSDMHVNITGYKNDRVDHLLHGACKTFDKAEREAMLQEVIDIVHEDAAWVFIAQPDFVVTMKDDIKGYVKQNTQLHHLWLLYRED